MAYVQTQTVKKQHANVWDAAVAAVQALAEQVKRGNVNGQLIEVQGLLEALPLSSGDFCRAGNNLRNAQRYMRSQEWGAAAYELRMLAGSVRSCLIAQGNGLSRPRRTVAHPALFE
jgi:hypothetical protein